MIWRLGEVEVCVKNASLKEGSTVWKSWSATTMIEPWRSDDIDLCTESVS